MAGSSRFGLPRSPLEVVIPRVRVHFPASASRSELWPSEEPAALEGVLEVVAAVEAIAIESGRARPGALIEPAVETEDIEDGMSRLLMSPAMFDPHRLVKGVNRSLQDLRALDEEQPAKVIALLIRLLTRSFVCGKRSTCSGRQRLRPHRKHWHRQLSFRLALP